MKKAIIILAVAIIGALAGVLAGQAFGYTYNQAVAAANARDRQACGVGATWFCAGVDNAWCTGPLSGNTQWDCHGEFVEQNIWFSTKDCQTGVTVGPYGAITGYGQDCS